MYALLQLALCGGGSVYCVGEVVGFEGRCRGSGVVHIPAVALCVVACVVAESPYIIMFRTPFRVYVDVAVHWEMTACVLDGKHYLNDL